MWELLTEGCNWWGRLPESCFAEGHNGEEVFLRFLLSPGIHLLSFAVRKSDWLSASSLTNIKEEGKVIII